MVAASSAVARDRRVLVLLTDAFGGHGGIAAYNRDVLAAMSANPRIAEIVALPRVAALPLGDLPPRLVFDTRALGGSRAYLTALARQVLRGGRFDLVYCAHVNLMPPAVVAARLLRVPLVLTIYGIDAWQPSPRRGVRLSAGRADYLLSISQLTLDRFLAFTPYPRAATALMPNAIHLDAFGVAPRNPALAARYGVTDRRVVMTFGRLAGNERYKGFDEVLEAMPALLQCFPDLVYLIAGGGNDRTRLEEKARALGIADSVVFTGFVDEAEKADLFRLADVYAMPSRGEGFGFVLLEAMACGIPVIASSEDGGREAVRDGMLGTLVDPADPSALIAAIAAALDRPKAIPPGLAHFAFPEFTARLNAVLDRAMVR